MGIETPGGFVDRGAQAERLFSADLDLGGLHERLFQLHAEGKVILGSDGTQHTGRELSDSIETAFMQALNLCEVSAQVTEEEIAQLPALLSITESGGLREVVTSSIVEKLRALGKI
jgi:hypothetical protein